MPFVFGASFFCIFLGWVYNVDMLTNTADKQIDYDKNPRRLLGYGRADLKVLRESAGILKGKLKISPVAYQREIRKILAKKVKDLVKVLSLS